MSYHQTYFGQQLLKFIFKSSHLLRTHQFFVYGILFCLLALSLLILDHHCLLHQCLTKDNMEWHKFLDKISNKGPKPCFKLQQNFSLKKSFQLQLQLVPQSRWSIIVQKLMKNTFTISRSSIINQTEYVVASSTSILHPQSNKKLSLP